MASSSPARVLLRLALVLLLLFLAFYVGRPLYWKLSATVQEIRENKQTVQQGISKIVLEAQRSVGWYHDESDSGFNEDRTAGKLRLGTSRRILRVDDSVQSWNPLPY